MSVNIKQADGLKRLSQTIEFYKSSSSISIPQLFTGSYNDLTDKPIVDGNATIESIETTQSSFYVQDGSGNIIALIDDQGVHSIDFYADGESVKQYMNSSGGQLNDLNDLNGEGDTLYINDALGNTIAIFDASGLTTTEVTIAGSKGSPIQVGTKIEGIESRVASVETKTQNISDEEEATLFEINDAAGNIAFQVNESSTVINNVTTKAITLYHTNDTGESVVVYDVGAEIHNLRTSIGGVISPIADSTITGLVNAAFTDE